MRSIKTIMTILAALLLLAASVCSAQDARQLRDKYTLLTIPYNMRPLTLYRGQLQALAGYKFSVRTQSFGSEGDLSMLKQQGTGSVYHYYFLDLKYGLTNFIELAAETNFLRRGIRDESQTITSASLSASDRVTINKLTEIKGMGDLLLRITVRPPIRYKWFDISASGGLFLPSSAYEPKQPAHTLTNVTAADSYTVNYKYRYRNGYGVPVYLLTSSVKLGYARFSGEISYAFRTPQREGKNIRWDETMVDKTFSYTNDNYRYLLNNSHSVDASIHFQAIGWFNVYLNTNYQKSDGGWTEYWGKKYRNPETRLLLVEPGFELQISPTLKIYQVAGFPISGKNSDAPFYLFTTISFSNFPFLR